MTPTPNPFAHETLASLREELLARKSARRQAIGQPARVTPAPRRWTAAMLRRTADWLARPEAAAVAPTNGGHIHVLCGERARAHSKG